MHLTNREILEKANEAIKRGDNEGFLAYCTDDMEWIFMGDRALAVRQYMAEAYAEPPAFQVDHWASGAGNAMALKVYG